MKLMLNSHCNNKNEKKIKQRKKRKSKKRCPYLHANPHSSVYGAIVRSATLRSPKFTADKIFMVMNKLIKVLKYI